MTQYWNEYYVADNGIPERMIQTLICRVPIMEDTRDNDNEVMRYMLMYTIFQFYYSNMSHLKKYVIILRNSLLGFDAVKDNEILYDYVVTISDACLKVQKAHLAGKLGTYVTLYQDIVNVKKIIVLLEKLVYMLMSGDEVCEMHIMVTATNMINQYIKNIKIHIKN